VPSAQTAVYTKSQAALYLRVAEASGFPRKDFMRRTLEENSWILSRLLMRVKRRIPEQT
jgi:hypothetical protein